MIYAFIVMSFVFIAVAIVLAVLKCQLNTCQEELENAEERIKFLTTKNEGTTLCLERRGKTLFCEIYEPFYDECNRLVIIKPSGKKIAIDLRRKK